MIGIVAYLFRHQVVAMLGAVTGLAGRIHKAGPVEFQPLAQQQQQPSQLAKEGERRASAPLQRHPLVVPFENHLRRNIKQQHLDQEPDFQDRLIYDLAEAIRTAQGETAGRLIFGTQLAALKQLDTDGTMTPAALNTLYEQHVHIAKEAGIDEPLSFLEWISFLTSRSLVRIDDDGRYAITDVGRSFLQYLGLIEVTEAKRPF
jgi:hypothetical protein